MSCEERERLGKLFPIEIVEYDPRWPQLYEEEARFLRERFGPDLIVRIEHYGSTAVPGLAAKPVIDVLVEITSFEAAEREIVPVLDEKLGYGYNWHKDHMVFFKGYFSDDPVKYHLHMAPGDHPLMDGLLFRVLGKGDKERLVPFGQGVRYALHAYLARRVDLSTRALFVTHYGDPLDRYRVRDIIERRSRLAGITGPRLSPHTLRHTFVVSDVQAIYSPSPV